MTPATQQSLPRIALCHCKAFPRSLASALGPAYVVTMLKWYLLSDKRFLFYIEEPATNRVIGYCGGMVQDGTALMGSSSGMAQESFWAAARALALRPWVFFHPELRNKYRFIWRNILVKLGIKKLKPKTGVGFNGPEDRKEPEAGLVVIGVDPAFQGLGYGAQLLQAFERHCMEVYGISKFHLTVRAANNQAIRAYERNGWEKVREERGSVLMMKRTSK